MSGDVITITGLFFLLFFLIYMIGSFDVGACPSARVTINTTLGAGGNDTWYNKGIDIVDHAFNSRCSGIPMWFNFLIYAPIIIGLIYSVIPFK